jgi:predicted DNA-binding transcriptional regulator AlpA
MTTIIQIDREELRSELRIWLMETLSEINNKPSSIQPDEGGIELAEEITGLKRPTIYKGTWDGSIPHKKFGKRLVFSRKELTNWVQSQTIRKQSPADTASQNLQKQAIKRLK